MTNTSGATSHTVEAYVPKGMKQVGGWLNPGAARLIAAMGAAPGPNGAVGEIGVHHGKLFILLDLLRRDGEASVAVDLFEDQERNIDKSGRGDRQVFETNLTKHSKGPAGVEIRAADSTTLSTDDLRGWAGGSGYRLFSVDGGHTAEITAHDLTIGSAALIESGLLVLDDYFNVQWPGVSEGTCRFMGGSPPVEGVGSAFGKTFFATPSAADGYRAIMRRVASEQGWKVNEREFFGRPHVVIRELRSEEKLTQRARSLAQRVPAVHKLAKRLKSKLGR